MNTHTHTRARAEIYVLLKDFQFKNIFLKSLKFSLLASGLEMNSRHVLVFCCKNEIKFSFFSLLPSRKKNERTASYVMCVGWDEGVEMDRREFPTQAGSFSFAVKENFFGERKHEACSNHARLYSSYCCIYEHFEGVGWTFGPGMGLRENFFIFIIFESGIKLEMVSLSGTGGWRVVRAIQPQRSGGLFFQFDSHSTRRSFASDKHIFHTRFTHREASFCFFFEKNEKESFMLWMGGWRRG